MPEEKMRYYDDFEVGEVTVYPGRYTLTEENILAVGKEWDPYPFHTDPEAAKDTFYGGLVACTTTRHLPQTLSTFRYRKSSPGFI
jgi:acyl dehydratase